MDALFVFLAGVATGVVLSLVAHAAAGMIDKAAQ